VERPLEELRQLSKTWEQKTWEEYLHWFESSRKDKLTSSDFYLSQCEVLEKNIFVPGLFCCPRTLESREK